MNKISVLFLAIAALFVTASCNDDASNPYAKDAQVTVINSNMVLDAVASEGIITFSANGTATASCAQSWCTVDVENNNTVRVKSTQNNGRESRSTLVVIHCNGDSVQVPVVQRGAELIFSELALPAITNDAQKLECHITTNMPISVASTPDWVTATLSSETGALELELTANTTGDYRRGWVKVNAGEFKDSIEVLQYDFDQFFETKKQTDLIVSKWGDHTLRCLTKGYRNILVDSGLGVRERRNIVVERVMIHPAVEKHIAEIGDGEFLQVMLGR